MSSCALERTCEETYIQHRIQLEAAGSTKWMAGLFHTIIDRTRRLIEDVKLRLIAMPNT